MLRRFSNCRLPMLLWLTVLATGSLTACSRPGATGHVTLSGREQAARSVERPFEIRWPLEDSSQPRSSRSRALLYGKVRIGGAGEDERSAGLRLRITLERPDDAAYREFWNNRVMYAELGWMQHVRVWDKDRQWLYPNLAYLFKLHGTDRIGRYGGWDPGKQVDNDFGAVLIRVYNRETGQELPETRDTPMVSAQWYASQGDGRTRHAVVHHIRSDGFAVRVDRPTSLPALRLKVWLVYGDFMGHPAPRSWPEEPEAAGAALAFFTVDWDVRTTGGRTAGAKVVVVRQQTPEPTRFDWTSWIGRSREEDPPVGQSRLSITLKTGKRRISD